ncbi:Hypothetical protein CINCED_3A007881 [Cinara cedri]|uniref:DNA-directed DNA polymerase n=1 Tax=Cinara cedri TaxID=506608 RepID=A0A5E4NRE9_9HEMI|nr:Hypothetical protein CINCED_3A007881 [Cinara cedri]
MNINMCKYNPLRGASYIKLPKIISVKKAITNIKNKDNKCFLWSILAALHPQDKNSETISKYKEWENESYRHVSLKHFKLDPVHYYTTPGFAWNAMFRKTGIELELITDIDIYLMFEQGIRGGLSQCSIRYSKTNNKYIGEKYKKEQTEKTTPKYLLNLDANNLYGWGMCEYLPYKGFKWSDPDCFDTE